MNKNVKRGAIAAVGAATLLSLVVATPSFAHGGKRGQASSTSVSNTTEAPRLAFGSDGTDKPAHAHATVAVTVTAVSADITDVALATRGAKFVAYALAADATALPAAQPTTGGRPVKITGTALTAGVLTGTLSIDAGAAGTTTKYAVYNAAGVGSLVTVTVDAAGVATATSSVALTTVWSAAPAGAMKAPAAGEGKHGKGHGKENGKAKGGRHGRD
jgi:hypothetical protein